MAGLLDISLGNFTEVRFGPAVGAPIPVLPTAITLGDVMSVGDISDEATIVDVQAYGQKYLKKLVGSANAAAIEIVCNYDPTDAGQIDLLAAYNSSTQRAIGIVMKAEDASFSAADGTYNIFDALIASASVTNSFDETRTITFSVVPTNGLGAYLPLA